MLEEGPLVTVEAVTGPARLHLAEGAGTLRLAGLWPEQGQQPYSEQARRALKELASGRKLRLFMGPQSRDRHGDWLAHATLVHRDGAPQLWIQAELLARGAARVYTTVRDQALAERMLALEAAARAAGLGLWASPHYAVRPAAAFGRGTTGFRLVEGRVESVSAGGRTAYINFGKDWRTDFTIVIESRHLRNFADGRKGIRALVGRTIRVRGWVFQLNGPSIRADHDALIEVLR